MKMSQKNTKAIGFLLLVLSLALTAFGLISDKKLIKESRHVSGRLSEDVTVGEKFSDNAKVLFGGAIVAGAIGIVAVAMPRNKA